VTFLVLALPLIRRCQGMARTRPEPLSLPAGFAVAKPGGREEYFRVRLQDGRLQRFANQSSGVLTSMAWADGLAVVPAGRAVAPGDCLAYYPFSRLLPLL